MSTIQSSTEHLTLNADGASKDIKFQANGVEVASIDSSGNFTSTSIDATKLSGTVPNFTSTGIDDNATSNAITIDASEVVGIGVTTPSTFSGYSALQLGDRTLLGNYPNDSAIFCHNGYSSAGWKYIETAAASRFELTGGGHRFQVAPSGTADTAISWTTGLTINNSGTLGSLPTYNQTTASAANMHISSAGGGIYRSTSSLKYKKDVETMSDSYADDILKLRPVWYRSKCDGDNPTHGYWGFIAEEVALIDERLVFWKTEEYTDVLNKETGETEQVATPLAEPEADGVQYDRMTPHIINLLQRQDATIKALEARVTALEL